MRKAKRVPLLYSLLVCVSVILAACSPGGQDNRPNIVLIVADDMGYTDLGRFGSEIPTPNLDMLANEGMVLTSFYASPTCSPTRSMLFSGTNSHLAGLGTMAEFPNERFGKPGYEGYLNFGVASLADLMTDAGYNTYMSGKWHLGLTEQTSPAARGFRRSFALLEGAAAHLGGLTAGGVDEQALYREDNGEIFSVDDDFYSTRDYTRKLIDYIDTDRTEDRPFFAYLAYTAPHWPLQAPRESIAQFDGLYDEGYEILYRSRLSRMEQQGLLPEGATAVDPTLFTARWASLSAEEQRTQSRRMEIYAAMVSDMDRYVGELIAYLQAVDEFDNTLIFFMSDNGADPHSVDFGPLAAGLGEWIARCCDNSFENLGAGDSFVAYGPDWAAVSGGPFRGDKTSVYEGGIRVPAFVYYPTAIRAGQTNSAPTSVVDLLPTFLELAEAELPSSRYRGRDIHPPAGTSLVPIFEGEIDSVHENDYFAREYYGNQSLRKGDWKIVLMPDPAQESLWQLFNLVNDPSEQNNVAAENEATMAELLSLWDEHAAAVGLSQ